MNVLCYEFCEFVVHVCYLVEYWVNYAAADKEQVHWQKAASFSSYRQLGQDVKDKQGVTAVNLSLLQLS